MSASKRKGSAYERELVKHFEAQGLSARRVYASGAVGTLLKQATGTDHQDLRGDVQVEIHNQTLCLEVKFRKHEFPQWLTAISEPGRTGDWLVYPGPDLHLALEIRKDPWTQKELKKTLPRTLAQMLGNSDILALRFPKKPQNPSGWLLLLPL